MLLGAGFEKAKKLYGGINAWAQEVDPSITVY
jgi:rhodanese-related sulfurtransferase